MADSICHAPSIFNDITNYNSSFRFSQTNVYSSVILFRDFTYNMPCVLAELYIRMDVHENLDILPYFSTKKSFKNCLPGTSNKGKKILRNMRLLDPYLDLSSLSIAYLMLFEL